MLLRIREQQKFVKLDQPIPSEYLIDDDDYVALLILGRGLAKSSSLEASAVMRGALLDSGYCLYISEAHDQAEEHIGNCRGLIDHEDSQLLQYYPRMAIVDDAVVGGIKTKNRSDIFITTNGWICRARGLNSKLRGLRIGTQRPDDIKLDDVDGVNDSVDVSVKKLKQIKSSVLPTQARRWATIDFGQNLIIETGVMNQLYSGQSDALAKRHTIGITKTFSKFEYESRLDLEDGKTKHYILPESIPTWTGVNIQQAQKFLHDSGLQTFMAEYQNDFTMLRQGRVLRNYDDALMVIRKSDFIRVFGSWSILDRFNKYVMHDWARTKSAYHANVMGKLAVSSQNTPLPGKLFLFDLMDFPAGTQADDVGKRLLESITPHVPDTHTTWAELIESSLSRVNLERFITDATRLLAARRDILAKVIAPLVAPILADKHYLFFRGSHDQNNDALMVYRNVYGLPFEGINPGATGGLEWADHYMQVDHAHRHPFQPDELLPDGKWKLGCPGLFIIVEDDKYDYPLSVDVATLSDSDLWRFQFSNWRTRPEKITEAGAVVHGPMKMFDDAGNALQMCLYDNLISAAPLTYREQVTEMIPVPHRVETMLANSPNGISLTPEQELTAIINIEHAKKKIVPQRTRWDEFGRRI